VGNCIIGKEDKSIKYLRRENLKEVDHLEDLGTDGRAILKRILEKLDGTVWTGFIWLRTGIGGGHL
jgi:hypothetical protein